MKLPRIFQNRPLNTNHYLELDKETSHRLTTVLRLKEGDLCILFNGEGDEYTCVIKTQKCNAIGVKVVEHLKKNAESLLEIHLGQVFSKGEKMDFVIQKATELGVHKITPLFSERSVVHLNSERVEKKTEHFQKIAIHAAEQCGRTVIPTIKKSILLTEWIFNRPEKTRLILDPTSPHSLKTLTLENSIALLIGPEGGFTEEELDYAIQHEFTTVRLGPRILRTETAALAAITAIQCIVGDLCL